MVTVLILVAIVSQERASVTKNEKHHTISHLLERADEKLKLLCQIIQELIAACDRANSRYFRLMLDARNSWTENIAKKLRRSSAV